MPSKILVPELGESIVEATVSRWLKKEGERVTTGEPVVELETEKIDLEVGAGEDGVLARIERKEGENVRIGDVLGVIEKAPKEAEQAPEEKKAGEEAPELVPALGGVEGQAPLTGPAERKGEARAARLGASEAAAASTGASIGPPSVGQTSQDLGGRMGVKVELPSPPPPEPIPTQPTPTPPSARTEVRERMSRRRLTIARRLVEAQHTAAMLSTFNEIDMTAVMDLRRRMKEEFNKRHGVRLGIVSFFVKASISALREFPRLNAEIQGDEMVLKHYYDIGVAVGAPEGLVVPVLRDAEKMSFAEIEKAIKECARKAEEGTLTLEDLRGGTFTITNGGVFGSLLSTPILNPPQVGILGLHKVEDRSVPFQGQVVIRPMMYVALTYDHRIVDGLEAVRFLVRIKELVEDPGNLLLES